MLWDGELKKFGCRISPKGTKAFILLLASGKRHTIGRYPTISLAEARTEAKRIFAEVTLGTYQQESFTLSVDECAEQFQKTREQRTKASTAAEYKRVLKKHFLPALGRKPIGDVTTRDVVKLIERLIPTPGECFHAFVAVKTFFTWATRQGLCATNPCERIQAPTKLISRDRFLTDTELAAVLSAAHAIGYPHGTIVELLALTGQRRGEIAALRWDWINHENKTITLPAAITKNNRQHTFPYGETVAAVLAKMPRLSTLLFPARGRDDVPFSGWSKSKKAFDETCDISAWVLHDLRRTFATNLAALGTPIHVTEKLLNHVSGTMSGIVAVYQRHNYMEEMRAAILAWEQRLSDILALHAPEPDKVTL